jgi:hypothetical protein
MVFLSRFFVDALFFLNKQSLTRQRSSTIFSSCAGRVLQITTKKEGSKKQAKKGRDREGW